MVFAVSLKNVRSVEDIERIAKATMVGKQSETDGVPLSQSPFRA
jgi:hypothetical protein